MNITNFEFIDQIFAKLAEKENNHNLTDSEQVVVDVWHTYGLIENGGFHNFLAGFEDDHLRVLNSYNRAGLQEHYICYKEALDLWTSYSNEHNNADPNHFRSSVEKDLTKIENSFYGKTEFLENQLGTFIKNEIKMNG